MNLSQYNKVSLYSTILAKFAMSHNLNGTFVNTRIHGHCFAGVNEVHE
jgi:hypothetical protein